MLLSCRVVAPDLASLCAYGSTGYANSIAWLRHLPTSGRFSGLFLRGGMDRAASPVAVGGGDEPPMEPITDDDIPF